MLTLFHAPHSRSSRIVWLLEELGAVYDIRYMSIRYADGSGDGPDPANLHPDKKVPALLHDGALVTESTAVAMRLCELFPEAELAAVPGSAERGAFLTWMCWTETEFGPAVYTRMAGQSDARTQSNYDAAVRRVLDALARGPYLMGERFTAVDVMAGAILMFARAQLPPSDAIDAYVARLASRPALARAMGKDAPRSRPRPDWVRRADRLFEIIQVFRRAVGPLTAEAIAAELETSKRTIYRDIAALIGQRVPIRGEAGIGYVLEQGFDMPPLMLTRDEIEAVVLGAQWVAAHADTALAHAAAAVLAKVAAVVPEELRAVVEDPAVATPPAWTAGDDAHVDVARLRAWSRQGRKLSIVYRDEAGQVSERTVWPFLVGYRDSRRMLMAWCELRNDFRMFRTDRLRDIAFLDERYPERRAALRRRWLALMAERRP